MNNSVGILGLILSLCALSLSADARPQPVFELDGLAGESDLIVLVHVIDVQQIGTTNVFINGTSFLGNRLVAECKVMENYKGETRSEKAQITVQFLQEKDVPLGMEGLRNGENAILFLKGGRTAEFVFTDGRCSKIPIGSFVSGIRRKDDSLRESIGRQIEANLRNQNPEASANAIYWANIIDYTITETTLGQLSASTNSNMKCVALMPQVRKGHKAAIAQAVNLLLSGNQVDRTRLEDLAWAVEGVAPSVSVEQANQLALSEDAMIRRIGLRILKTRSNESSVPALLAGLDVEDKDAQYSAVVGLCRVTERSGPSLREFIKNRNAEISRWKVWAAERGLRAVDKK